MFSRRNITTTLLAVIFATGCGGGSGGGSGSSSGGGKRSISTGIRLMHSSVDAVPVDLFVDGKKVVSANFGETTAYNSVKAGKHALEVKSATGASVGTRDIEFKKNQEYTMLLAGRVDGIPAVGIVVSEDNVQVAEKGMGLVRLIHLSSGSRSSKAVAGGVTIPETFFGRQGPAVSVPPGVKEVVVTTSLGQVVKKAINIVADAETVIQVLGDEDLSFIALKEVTDRD